MSSFKDGRFIFVDTERCLRVESASKSNSFQLFYGGVVLAFALNEAQTMIALVCPSDAATGLTPSEHPDEEKCCVRLFGFAEDGLGDLIAELEIPTANQILWVGERFLVASYPRTLSTIIELTKKTKLKIFVKDKGTFPIALGGLLGLFSGTDASSFVELWDLARNKKVDTIHMNRRTSGRRGGSGKGKSVPTVSAASSRVVSSCSSGNLAVLGHADGSFTALYGGKRDSVKLLTQAKTQQHKQRQRGSPASATAKAKPQGESQRDAAEGDRVLCAALSCSHVVVGSCSLGEIRKFSYPKKDTVLHEEGVARVAAGDTLIALTPTRFLVRRAAEASEAEESASQDHKAIYVAYPINVTASVAAAATPPHKNGGEAETVGGGGSGENAEGGMGKRERKQKGARKDTATNGASDGKAGGVVNDEAGPPPHPHSSGSRNVPTIALVAGVACVAIAVVALQLRHIR